MAKLVMSEDPTPQEKLCDWEVKVLTAPTSNEKAFSHPQISVENSVEKYCAVFTPQKLLYSETSILDNFDWNQKNNISIRLIIKVPLNFRLFIMW